MTTNSNLIPYFQNNIINLYHSDNLKWLKNRPSNSVDMIFADPPYFLTNDKTSISYKGDWDLSKGIKADFTFQARWIKEVRRVLKKDGCIWITGTHHSIYQCGFALQLLGFHIINQVCWYKPKKRYADIRNALAYHHETVILARKSKDTKHYFNCKYLTASQDKFHKSGDAMPSIWDIKPCTVGEISWHRTPKPVALVKRAIMLTTKPNSIILDPFNGSGTTGIAVMECGYGRKYIGLDNNKYYLDKSIERIQTKQQLFNPTQSKPIQTQTNQQKIALARAKNKITTRMSS